MSVRSINQNDEPPLVSEEAGLYLWNLDGEQFEVVELNVHATIVKHENGPFDCEADVCLTVGYFYSPVPKTGLKLYREICLSSGTK